MGQEVTDYQRVFTEGGTVAHLLDWNASPNDTAASSLCGRTAWPGYWHGTGSQDEEERVQDMQLCVGCGAVLMTRSGGHLAR